jgi:hypothetical protein
MRNGAVRVSVSEWCVIRPQQPLLSLIQRIGHPVGARNKAPVHAMGRGRLLKGQVRVLGESPRSTITIYRYESPGPFKLTILFEREQEDLEHTYRKLRREVLEALDGWVWKALQPRTVTLIKL